MSGQGLVPNVSVLPALANGTFGAAAEYAVGGNLLTQGIGVGDVTGDGRNDVVASYGGNSPSGRLGVFAQSPAGTLVAPPVPYQSYDIPSAVEVSDVDRDGRSDAIVVHEGWLRVGLYRGQAGGQLAGEDLYPVPYSNGGNPQGLAVGDVHRGRLAGHRDRRRPARAADPPERRGGVAAVADADRRRAASPTLHAAAPDADAGSDADARPRRRRPRPTRRPRRPRRRSRRRHPSRSPRARTSPPASA